MGSTPRPVPCLPLLCPSGTGLVLHAAVLGRCWLPRRYLTLVKADGSEDPEGVRCGRVAVCAAVRSKLAKPGQCGTLLFEERAVLSRQASLQRTAGALCVYVQGPLVGLSLQPAASCRGLRRAAACWAAVASSCMQEAGLEGTVPRCALQ